MRCCVAGRPRLWRLPALALSIAVLLLGAPASATASGSVTQYLGSLGSGTVDPGFAASTSTHTKEFIDFDGDGFDGLAPHTYTPIPPAH